MRDLIKEGVKERIGDRSSMENIGEAHAALLFATL
jgi:hypothetical protein